MTGPNTALALMVRPSKPKRGASHILLEEIADSLFRGPAKVDHGIDLLIRETHACRLSQGKALAQIPDIAVPHMLEGREGAKALIVFDGALVDALIEQQTLGRISAAPRVERPVTAIDAALSMGFAVSLTSKLAEVSVDRRDAKALTGYSCGSSQTDRAALSLSLSEPAYDVLKVTLDLGPGLKTAQAILLFPAAKEVEKPKPKKINPAMVAALKDCDLQVTAHLPSIRLPATTLLGLEEGSVIPLPQDILFRTHLCDRDGVLIGKGRLGQLNGCRAFRLDGPEQSPMNEVPLEQVAQLPPDVEVTQTSPDVALPPLNDLPPEVSPELPPELSPAELPAVP
ncbi:MAG: FliM/FliN family flagellar motor C-terminal domain-containing protein [Litoreibacter sp.]|uniref:FliM/FliN family flagellar motor C-terminal domain-containing protein n=1 Tax=Litoreibacter sp. TaxID=1969459 RepID=UPI00329898B1